MTLAARSASNAYSDLSTPAIAAQPARRGAPHEPGVANAAGALHRRSAHARAEAAAAHGQACLLFACSQATRPSYTGTRTARPEGPVANSGAGRRMGCGGPSFTLC